MDQQEAAALVGRYFVSDDAGDIYQVLAVAPVPAMSSGWSMRVMSDRVGAECDDVDAALTATDYAATSHDHAKEILFSIPKPKTESNDEIPY